jgi:uncharacterized protein
MTGRPACPTCRRAAAARAVNPAFPFCSERCRLVDLGRGLGEADRIPTSDPLPGTEPGDGDRES